MALLLNPKGQFAVVSAQRVCVPTVTPQRLVSPSPSRLGAAGLAQAPATATLKARARSESVRRMEIPLGEL